MELQKISLLNLMKTFDIGGVERSTILYSNNIAGYINKVTIMACRGFYCHENIISPNVKTFFFPFKINHNPLSLFLNLFTLLNVISNEKINCINYHQRIFLPYILCIKFIFRKIKIIYTGHNVFGDWLNRFLTADQFIAISDVVRKDLITASKKNVNLIYHGIMIKEIANINLKENATLNFGYVGRYTKIKGVMTLLRAFKLFHEKYPNNQLIIRGSGELLEEMKKYISNSALTESIIIMPHENDIEKIFDKIDILIFPSEYLEGFGLVIH